MLNELFSQYCKIHLIEMGAEVGLVSEAPEFRELILISQLLAKDDDA